LSVECLVLLSVEVPEIEAFDPDLYVRQWFSTNKKVPLPLAYTGWPGEWIMI
jgi:hypothetical protein